MSKTHNQNRCVLNHQVTAVLVMHNFKDMEWAPHSSMILIILS